MNEEIYKVDEAPQSNLDAESFKEQALAALKARGQSADVEEKEVKLVSDNVSQEEVEVKEELPSDKIAQEEEKQEEKQEEEKQEELEPYKDYGQYAKYAKELADTGDVSSESVKEIVEKYGVPEVLVKEYVELGKQNRDLSEKTTQAEVEAFSSKIKESIGGEKVFNEMSEWAKGKLNESELKTYNSLVEQGGDQARLAVEGLFARYSKENNVLPRPRLIEGQHQKAVYNGYRNQAELQADLNDPRYISDPNYRVLVQNKVKRSNQGLLR